MKLWLLFLAFGWSTAQLRSLQQPAAQVDPEKLENASKAVEEAGQESKEFAISDEPGYGHQKTGQGNAAGTSYDSLPQMNQKVLEICLAFTVVAFIWFACGIFGLFPASSYTKLETAHIILLAIAMYKSPQKMPLCDCSRGLFMHGGVLLFFMVLDHMDMATDLMFVGSAAACSSQFSERYTQTWSSVPVIGAELGYTMQEIHLTGLAFFVFVMGAYLPQLVGLTPFAALCFSGIGVGTLLLNLHYGWVAAAICAAVVLLVLILSGFFKRQWGTFVEANADDEKTLALYGCMGIFEMLLSEGQQNERLLFVGMTRLVFENLLQLWLQTSFFALTFADTSNEARLKAVASMVIGLLVLASKVPGLISELRSGSSPVNLFGGLSCESFIAWILLVVVICYALAILYISAKIFFAFRCPSHLWNLTTSCLP